MSTTWRRKDQRLGAELQNWLGASGYHHRSAELQFGPVRTRSSCCRSGDRRSGCPDSAPWWWYPNAPKLARTGKYCQTDLLWQVISGILKPMNKTKIIAYLKPSCGWSNGVRAVLKKYDLPYEDG